MRRFLTALLFCCTHTNVMADELSTIDDRRSGDDHSSLGNAWRLITDRVMGGVSNGQLTLDRIGIVTIGRSFEADLCFARVALYGSQPQE